MKALVPAILTVWISLTCGTRTSAWSDSRLSGDLRPDQAFDVGVDQSEGIASVAEADSELPEGGVTLAAPFSLRTRDLTGTTRVGRVASFDDRGLAGDFGTVRWLDLAPPDRFRLGREVLRKSRRHDAAGLGWLLFMLRSTDSGEFCDRAEKLVRASAGVDADRIIAAAEKRAQEVRDTAEQVRLAAEAARLKQGRPHLRSTSVAAWTVPDPMRQGVLAEQLREKGEAAAEGLGLKGVCTGSTVVLGLKSLDSLAREGVAFDRLTSEIAPRLGLMPGRNPFPGALLVMDVVDHDTLRLMASTMFDHEAPLDDDSILFPTDDGPFVIRAMPDRDRMKAISKAMSGGDPLEMLRALERARIVTRACLLHAHTRRSLPPWLVEGVAEYMASTLVADAPVDSIRRRRALRSMRSGRHPGWIIELDGDDEGFDLDGLARDVAYVLVTRLFETAPDLPAGLVDDLKNGMTPDQSFRRRMGGSINAWFDDSAEWFRFND